MITKITELLNGNFPLRPIDKKLQIAARIEEMAQVSDVLKYGDNIYIVGYDCTINPSGGQSALTPTPEFKKIMTEYLNDRLIELAKEVQILQGVTPIEYKESEGK